jgi:hypothetical protein
MREPLAPNAIVLIVPLLAGVAGPAFAAPLPPPPYAADDAQYAQPQYGQTQYAQPQYGQPQYGQPQASGGGAPAFDRYGGGASHPTPRAPVPQYAFATPSQGMTPAPAQNPQRTLGWAGKVLIQRAPIQTASVQAAPAGGWSRQATNTGYPTYALAERAPTQGLPAQGSAPQASGGGWRAMPPPVRRTIYDPPQANTARQPAYAQVQQTPNGPRFYSLHRDYGIQPDAIPIPPQFFGPTADLSAPPGDPVVKRVTNAAGQTRTVAVGGDDTSAQ